MLNSVYDIISIVLSTCVVVWGTIIVRSVCKYLKRKLDIHEYEINLNFDSTGIKESLDILVQECIDEYMAINIAFRDDLYYITESIQDDMRDDITDMVTKRLSPGYVQKLSTIYNTESIYEVVGERIYLAITAYVVQFNAGKSPTPSK